MSILKQMLTVFVITGRKHNLALNQKLYHRSKFTFQIVEYLSQVLPFFYRPRFFKSRLTSSGDSSQVDHKPTSKAASKPDASASKAAGKLDVPVQLRQKKTPERSPEPAERPEDRESGEDEDMTRPRVGTVGDETVGLCCIFCVCLSIPLSKLKNTHCKGTDDK